LGISVWEKRVPFATSSIRGSRGTPWPLKRPRKVGNELELTGDKNNKDEKFVNGTQIFHWPGSFHRENRTTFSEVPFIPINYQWNKPKSRVPFTSQPEFPAFFGK